MRRRRCVVDTGVDLTADTQPFVTNRLTVTGGGLLDDMLVPYGHGTAVSAAMGAPRNGAGGVGIWPHVRVISVRATSQLNAGQANFSWPDYSRALRLCMEQPGVKTVNFSLGGSVGGIDYVQFTDDVLAANLVGVSVVASAGNTPGAPAYPAAAAGVVAVAANDSAAGGALYSFSASAPGILSAPGCNVEGSSKTGDVFGWNGTSFAAPLVSALLTSLRAYRPDLSRHQVEDIVRQTAPQTADGRSVGVDAEAAFRAAGLGAMVDAAKAKVPGATTIDGPPILDVTATPIVVVRPSAPKVRWVRKINGAVVIRIAPLGQGVRLKLTGAGLSSSECHDDQSHSRSEGMEAHSPIRRKRRDSVQCEGRVRRCQGRNSMIRRALTLAALATIGASSSALAGTYNVNACGTSDTVLNGINNTWVASATDPGFLNTGSACPATAPLGGLYSTEILGVFTVPEGARAEWRFTAPTNTTISGMSLSRALEAAQDDDWRAYTRTDTADLEVCQTGPGVARRVSGGGFTFPASPTTVTFSGLSAAWAAIGAFWVDSSGRRNTSRGRSCDGSTQASRGCSCDARSDVVAWSSPGRAA